jgi:hypothetical protein
MTEEEVKKFAQRAIDFLENAVMESGYPISGATDYRAEDSGAPLWVCNAREIIVEYYNYPALWTDDYLVYAHERGCMGQDADEAYTAGRHKIMASIAYGEIIRRLSLKQ